MGLSRLILCLAALLSCWAAAGASTPTPGMYARWQITPQQAPAAPAMQTGGRTTPLASEPRPGQSATAPHGPDAAIVTETVPLRIGPPGWGRVFHRGNRSGDRGAATRPRAPPLG